MQGAVLAFPAPRRQKVLGLLAGSLIIQVLSIARFISLFCIGQYSMTWCLLRGSVLLISSDVC